MSKKSGKSLKEKRAAEHAKSAARQRRQPTRCLTTRSADAQRLSPVNQPRSRTPI
jgi:hypothetical protein